MPEWWQIRPGRRITRTGSARMIRSFDVYQKFLREGASYTTRVAVKGNAAFVKGIVYDYEADLLGSAITKVP